MFHVPKWMCVYMCLSKYKCMFGVYERYKHKNINEITFGFCKSRGAYFVELTLSITLFTLSILLRISRCLFWYYYNSYNLLLGPCQWSLALFSYSVRPPLRSQFRCLICIFCLFALVVFQRNFYATWLVIIYYLLLALIL